MKCIFCLFLVQFLIMTSPLNIWFYGFKESDKDRIKKKGRNINEFTNQMRYKNIADFLFKTTRSLYPTRKLWLKHANNMKLLQKFGILNETITYLAFIYVLYLEALLQSQSCVFVLQNIPRKRVKRKQKRWRFIHSFIHRKNTRGFCKTRNSCLVFR